MNSREVRNIHFSAGKPGCFPWHPAPLMDDHQPQITSWSSHPLTMSPSSSLVRHSLASDAPSVLCIDSFTQSTVTCLPRARPGIKMLRQRPRRGQALMYFSRAPWTALPPPLLTWALQKWVALVPLLLLIFLGNVTFSLSRNHHSCADNSQTSQLPPTQAHRGLVC